MGFVMGMVLVGPSLDCPTRGVAAADFGGAHRGATRGRARAAAKEAGMEHATRACRGAIGIIRLRGVGEAEIAGARSRP
jgi:hypothetical protein